ncbi:TatD family hydrolase [Chloroflexota bacterium]
MLIDSHAHLNLPAFDGDRERVVARAWENGVDIIINIGIDLESSQRALEIAERYPGMFATVGIHPNDVGEMAAGDIERLEELAGHKKAVAIGEIGLDFYRESSPRERQLDVFWQQLEMAARLGLPVVIHCRDAYREMEGILAEWLQSTPHPLTGSGEIGVMHCFSGDVESARRYIELGFLVSLAGPVTYPSAHDRVWVAKGVPLERLLVETDSPFLAPQLHRGQRNEPAYVMMIVDRIAQLRGVAAEAIARATADNAVRLFRLTV